MYYTTEETTMKVVAINGSPRKEGNTVQCGANNP